MQLSIDERSCSKYKLSPQQVLVALAVKSVEDFKALWKDLLEREVIVKHEGQWMITQRWNDRVDDILMESTGKAEDEGRLLALAKKMREAYPEGKMPGTGYYYRCNNSEIVLKMKRFFLGISMAIFPARMARSSSRCFPPARESATSSFTDSPERARQVLPRHWLERSDVSPTKSSKGTRMARI